MDFYNLSEKVLETCCRRRNDSTKLKAIRANAQRLYAAKKSIMCNAEKNQESL